MTEIRQPARFDIHPVTAYVQAVWRSRYFWLSLVRIDLRRRYRRSLLGLGWTLLQPLTMTTMFCLIVRPLLMPEKPVIQCALFFLTGLVCWQFIVNATVQGCHALLRGEAYIRQFPAPMAIYPLRSTLGFAVHLLLVATVVAVCSFLWHRGGNALALGSLLPTLLLVIAFGWSLAVLTSFANVYYQDMQHLCEVGFQILFYATPILYGPEVFSGRNLHWILCLNPVVPLLALLRDPIVFARIPSPATYAWALAVVSTCFLAACTTLATQQRRIIFYI